MNRFLLCLLLFTPVAFKAQDNPNYDPDYNGDGCFSITDVLGLLPLFGSCVEAETPLACDDSVLFDSYWYETVLIGDQCWFAENLRTTAYANGDLIPTGLTSNDWSSTSAGATTIYGEGSLGCGSNSPAIDACDEAQSLEEYGRLYNWYAVEDLRGLCPSGWHVPTDGEWTELEDYITSQGFAGNEGAVLKSTTGWYNNGNDNGTDDFGFSANPGGLRSYDPLFGGAAFSSAGVRGEWWSSSAATGLAWIRSLYFNDAVISRYERITQYGISVRCLKSPPLQGCTDSSYIEFNPSAELDDGSCLTLLVPGCTDSLYAEFDPLAIVDDGSCLTLLVPGCTDPNYIEFDPLANVDDGSCLTLVATEWACGDSVLFDNYWYKTVLIGDQCWFAENLRTSTYADGTAIPEVTDNSTWAESSTGARCDFGNDASNVVTYGLLYNWFATTDSAGLCPANWHVPTDLEWSFLEIEIGMGNDVWSSGWRGTEEGSKLKSAIEWDGTNATGYSAIPSGVRIDNGNFDELGEYGHMWSSSPLSDWAGWRRTMRTGRADVLRAQLDRNYGLSVRCMRDAE